MSSTYTDETARTRAKASETAASVQDAARETVEQYSQAARRTMDDVAERTSRASREMSGAVQEVAGNFREAVERSVEKQPVTTVLLAMAAGVILGGLMRR